MYDEGDYSERNQVVTVGITPILLSRAPASGVRKNITITNTSPGAQRITISKGIGLAVSEAGVVLSPTGQYTDSTISPNARCYQGTISVISDVVAGQVSVSEEFE